MPHYGLFITIEGIEEILSTHDWTAEAGPWNGRTFIDCVKTVGKVKYSVDPAERKADVGVLTVNLVDAHGTGSDAPGELTRLFAIDKAQTALWLDSSIQQGDAMAGAGVVTADKTIPASTAPCVFHIERETFYAATQNAKTLTGVTRALYGSRADYHPGYTDFRGYRPKVYLNSPSWKDRIAKVYQTPPRLPDGGAAPPHRRHALPRVPRALGHP